MNTGMMALSDQYRPKCWEGEDGGLESSARLEVPVRKGRYVNVVKAVLDKDKARVFGLLEDGGWISLISVDTKKPWAIPVRVGPFEIVYDGTEIGIDAGHSKTIGFLQRGAIVSISETKAMDKIGRVRGKLASGGWISLVSMETGDKTWATPIRLGVYEILHDVTVHRNEHPSSEPITTLYRGTYVQVISFKIMERIGRLRGRLQGGGWISLWNLETLENTWATPVPLGVYELIHVATISTAKELDSQTLHGAEKGSYVDVVEVTICESISRVRGRLSSGGWISLVNLDTSDKSWAMPMQMGAYRIIQDTIVTEAETSGSSGSKNGATLQKGQFVQVVELKLMQDIARVRGRLIGGGWISLVNLDSKQRPWATPVQVGAYQIMSDTVVTETEHADSAAAGVCFIKGEFVEVTEAKVNDGFARVRGRIRDCGWISLVNLDRAEQTWPVPVQLGAYYCTPIYNNGTIQVTASENIGSKVVAALIMGQYVNLIQAKVVHDGYARVRGRLDGGGWVSLWSAEGEQLLNPVYLGMYQVLKKLNVTQTEDPESHVISSSQAGAYVQVVEAKTLERFGTLRGRMIGGGWLSLVDLEYDAEQLTMPAGVAKPETALLSTSNKAKYDAHQARRDMFRM
jgi:hypothetical protein